MLARAHKEFQREQHSEIYLLTLKEQDKTKMELPLDMVSILASICRTKVSDMPKTVRISHYTKRFSLKACQETRDRVLIW